MTTTANPGSSSNTVWQRFKQAFTEPAPPPRPLTTTRESEAPIIVAAKGAAFDFQVHPTLRWRTEDVPLDEFEQLIALRTASVEKEVCRKAASLAREFEPHEAQRFEEALARSIGPQPWRIGRGDDPSLTCQVQARVVPDKAVRQAMQPYWQRRIEIQSQHDLGMLRAELVRVQTEAWSSIMEKLQDNPLTRHAANLTEEQFARVYGEMHKARQDATTRLLDLLQNAARGHRSIGLYEYAETFDAALQAFQKDAGLSLPTDSE
jgi:hypothetical protein